MHDNFVQISTNFTVTALENYVSSMSILLRADISVTHEAIVLREELLNHFSTSNHAFFFFKLE